MQQVSYIRPRDIDAALEAVRSPDAAFYAGGTTLVDLMKLSVAAPRAIVDINRLPLGEIALRDGTLSLGALARLSDVAGDARVVSAAPAIAQALAASASGQLRNMATLGGNVLQRTRCAYFRDVATPCNKREPGSGCGARTGLNAAHAILGTSEQCIAVHASDFAVPLVAFDAIVNARSGRQTRAIPIAEFFLQPGDAPARETTLRPGELIVSMDVPANAAAQRSTYVKVRDRTSYAFALASCAAGVEFASDGTLRDVRIALGGMATIPWRATRSEEVLRGKAPGREVFAEAARAEFARARPTAQNAYKVDLGIAAMVRALETVTA